MVSHQHGDNSKGHEIDVSLGAEAHESSQRKADAEVAADEHKEGHADVQGYLESLIEASVRRYTSQGEQAQVIDDDAEHRKAAQQLDVGLACVG